MTFVNRKINVTFQLGTGNFGESGFNTVKITGLRVHASIVKTGDAAMGSAELRIFGLMPDQLNSLTSIYQVQTLARQNTIIVEAGDDISGMSVIFQGQITIAQADLNSQPDSCLSVIAQAGLLYALQPGSPLSYPTTADAATILQNLAGQMGLQFENNGASVILATPYFSGSLRDQALACVRAAGINWIIDDKVLAIWPLGGSRNVTNIPLISTDTGMVGYPSYSNIGVAVKTIFNPNIKFGGKIKIQSSLKQANGTWSVFGLSHELESELPGGQWFSNVNGSMIPNG